MNPYPGLRPFRQDEVELYSGRKVILQSAATRVRVAPLTLLVARSGVGKSSFLTCRLMPKLLSNSSVRYRNEWGGATTESLIERELEQLQNDSVSTAAREKPVLLLDQFEDVFKLQRSRVPLWNKLAEVVNVPSPPVQIMISMREEWLGAWGESADYLPDALRSIVRLVPLTDRELTDAIRRPAETEGTTRVDPDLVAVILKDLRKPSAFGLGGQYVEPGMLQLVCRRLWQEAQDAPGRRMTVELYERLGGADRICRDFVWDELGNAGDPSSKFSATDRVLWIGMTRHLVVAQGIKAISDSRSMALKLRTEDLGFAGRAVAHACLPKDAREYLNTVPERRGEPPEKLVAWIESVVRKGVDIGFLKQQRGRASTLKQSGVENIKPLFEISHDALSDMFQQFYVEFESWLRGRWAKLFGALTGGLVGLPLAAVSVWENGWLATVKLLGIVLAVLVVYFAILLVMVLVMDWLFTLIGFPIVRRLARGSVPQPPAAAQAPSLSSRALQSVARRWGFLPK